MAWPRVDRRWAGRVSQWVVGAVFTFSGTVKCIDPPGTAIKLGDYFQAFGWPAMSAWAMPLAVALCMAELLIGIHVLFGRWQRLFLPLVTAFMVVFTLLTLYVVIADPVSDCGCFGDAIVLSNEATLAKNIVLCLLLIPLWRQRATLAPLWARRVTSRSFLIYSVWVCLFGAFLCWRGIAHQPLLDFRPFVSGVDILEAMGLRGGGAEEEYLIVYEKEGEQREFSLDALPDPDSGWTFVRQRVIQRHGGDDHSHSEKPIRDFSLTDSQGDDITPQILDDPGYCFLWLSPSLDGLDGVNGGHLRRLSQFSKVNGYSLFVATATDTVTARRRVAAVNDEIFLAFGDITVMKTIIRADPALLLLRDGVLLWKENCADVDFEALVSAPLEGQIVGQKVIVNEKMRIFWMLVLLFAPFALILRFGNVSYG